MEIARRKLIQYLTEAHGMELGLARDLQAQALVTPKGRYRSALERHRKQTEEHADLVRARLDELDAGRNPITAGLGLAQSVTGQALALGRMPLTLMRGGSTEERVLKNAKDACAFEALEIATYQAIEQLARRVNDEKTARMAVRIGQQEQKMLDTLRAELPTLADAVVDHEILGHEVYDPADSGTGRLTREAGRTAKKSSRRAGTRAKKTARQARRVPGVTRMEGEVRGAVASEGDLAIGGYDELSAEQVSRRLGELSQIELAETDGYERRHHDRATVRDRIAQLRGHEPWVGYDDMSVAEVTKRLHDADMTDVETVREYEQRHKKRNGVLRVADRQTTTA